MTGNGGIEWICPFGKNAAYKEAMAPFDLEDNNKFDNAIEMYKMKTPMAMYLDKVYNAIMSVPREPDVIVEVDQASLDELMEMLKAKTVTIDLNGTNMNTTAILTGTHTFTMKAFIKNMGFAWDYENKHYVITLEEDGALQELSNELKEMCTEWAITYTDHTL